MIAEGKKAARVSATLEAINNRDLNKVASEHGKQKLGHSLAKIVLQDLPEKVGTYEHSKELPFISATRYEGEIWNEEIAQDWATNILQEYSSEFKNR